MGLRPNDTTWLIPKFNTICYRKPTIWKHLTKTRCFDNSIFINLAIDLISIKWKTYNILVIKVQNKNRKQPTAFK